MTTDAIGTLRVYGCGGCGVNVAGYFNNSGTEPNCAKLLPAFIDTSRSNMDESFDDENIFILPNVDGSGKVRKENHQEIANVIKQLLLKLEPGDFNVVVFSASGGSGSVFGPLLLAELLNRKLAAVCVVVGSDESIITTQNTVNSLKSLESISKRTHLPVIMFYEHNDHDKLRTEVDVQIQLVISSLAVLSSKRNRELDSMDIINWLQFNKTTSVAPQLAQLEVFKEPKDVEGVPDPISIVSLYRSQSMPPIRAVPEYHAAGYFRDSFDGCEQLHFTISIDAIPNIVGRVQQKLDHYNEHKDGRVKQSSIVRDSDKVEDSGLIL